MKTSKAATLLQSEWVVASASQMWQERKLGLVLARALGLLRCVSKAAYHGLPWAWCCKCIDQPLSGLHRVVLRGVSLHVAGCFSKCVADKAQDSSSMLHRTAACW